MTNHYEIIYISESGFQGKIIEYLIANVHPNNNYLWIQSKNRQFEDNEGRIYKIDLNHVKGIVKSIPYVFEFPRLSCDLLIGTQFTGVNSRFFEAIIEYKELHLIDDGIGTPLILKSPSFYKSQPTSLLKFYLVRCVLLIKLKYLKTTKKLIKTLSKYYSIYNLSSIEIPIKKIEPFSLNEVYVQNDYIGYIGQPLVEYKMIDEKEYINHLKAIIKKFNKPIKYYPDPSEKIIFHQNIEFVEIVDKNEPLESFIIKHGMPSIIISYVSSALLNLKLMNPKVTAYYSKIPNQDSKRKLYYDIFEQNNIKMLKL